MNLQEIKQAIEEGKIVYWSNSAYRVNKYPNNQYVIECMLNRHCIGLTWLDGKTMNGEEKDFYTE